MKLNGSCHCQAVTFSLDSVHVYPYQRCYCSICRKTQGGGGFAINLSGQADTLRIEGGDALTVYRARMVGENGEVTTSSAERSFCRHCGSALWLFSPDYPDLIHPFASCIDSDLPIPPEHTHLMLGSRASWVEPAVDDRDQCFNAYPKESIADWHARLGLNG